MTMFDDLPGAVLISEGLADLADRRESVAAYLVQIGSPKLRRCGIEVPVSDEDALAADHRLYSLLGREHGNDAHRRYNALLRELVSFERALEGRHGRMSVA
jgi:hypothetical protein